MEKVLDCCHRGLQKESGVACSLGKEKTVFQAFGSYGCIEKQSKMI